MRTQSRLFLVSAIILVLVQVTSAQSGRDNSITGRLVFTTPASCLEVSIELERMESQAIDTTYPDVGCTFRFNRVQRGSYFIHINAAGYSEVRQSVEVGDSVMMTPIIISMIPVTTRIVRQSANSGHIVDATEFLDQYPKKAVNFYKKALGYRKKGKNDQAIANLEQAVQLAPDFYQAHNELGVLYNAANRPEDAERHLVRAHELNRRSPDPLVNLGRLYLDDNRPDRAVDVSQEAVRVDSKSVPALFNLGLAFYRLSRLDKAEDVLMKALKLAPKMFQIHLALANIYLKLHRYDQTLEQLNTYLDENPSGPEREQVERLRQQLMKAKQDER